MALWVEVVDKFRGKRTLDKVPLEDLDREKISLDLKERQQISQSQQLERKKEGYFAQGLKESSDAMKLYYARKVKEIDSDVRLNNDTLRALSHKIRIYNGIVNVKKRALALSGEKKTMLDKFSVAQLTQWIEKNTVDGELKQRQLDDLVSAVERGTSVIADFASSEETDVQQIFNIMKSAPVAVKPPEEIARESMPQVNAILRERE